MKHLRDPSTGVYSSFSLKLGILILSGIGEAFLNQNIKYHCPIYSVFKYDKLKKQSFKRKIFKHENGDYESLRQRINDFNWLSLENPDINIYAENFTNKFLELCEVTIPNKMITVRSSDPPWINGHIRRLIRKRKRAHKKAKRFNTPGNWRAFRKIRNDVINAIRKSKKDLKDELAKKLNSKNISGKDWWKTFKCLIGKGKHSPIPPLNHNGDQINDPSEKANIFNKYFQLQSQLDDTNKAVPNLTPNTYFPP